MHERDARPSSRHADRKGRVGVESEFLAADRLSEFLKLAAKINPSDIDTQRCIRYIAMQSEKKAQEQQKPKGLFSMFKERFGKGQ